jgi:hypothetical protein
MTISSQVKTSIEWRYQGGVVIVPRERQILTKCESYDAAQRRMCDRARKGDPSLLSRECSARKRMAALSKLIFDTSVGDKYPPPFVVARLGNPYE